MNLSPVERAQGWGLETDTAHSPAASQGHIVLSSTRKGWARGSVALVPQSRRTCPRSRHRGCRPAGQQPDCASRAPSLCTKIAREMPAGTLRKVGGSWPARTRWGWDGGKVSTCCGSPGRSRLDPRRHRRCDWRDQGRPEPGWRWARASPSAQRLSCLSFPPEGSVGGNFQDVQGPEVSAAGSWGVAGRGRRAARGPGEGTTGVGGLGGVIGGCGWRTKRRHHPAARANGMNGL